MTCIVGFTGANGDVALGADSIGICTYNLQKSVRLDPKVFQVGEALFGCAGSFRGINILMYELQLPERPEGYTDHQYLCTKLVPEIQRLLAARNMLSVMGDATIASETVMLIVYRGTLFTIESDFQVGISNRGYEATGCGAPYALGALEGVLSLAENIKPQKAVEIALNASVEHSAGVSAPFSILLAKNPNPEVEETN